MQALSPEVLLQAGAEPNLRDESNQTAKSWACLLKAEFGAAAGADSHFGDSGGGSGGDGGGSAVSSSSSVVPGTEMVGTETTAEKNGGGVFAGFSAVARALGSTCPPKDEVETFPAVSSVVSPEGERSREGEGIFHQAYYGGMMPRRVGTHCWARRCPAKQCGWPL